MTIEDIEPDVPELAATAPVKPESPTFADLGVRAETVAALEAVGIVRTFAIQEYAVPIALRGADLIGQAPTGTGKTLGFGVPLLQRVTTGDEGSDGHPQALVVVPTRELCLQVARDISAAGKLRRVRVLPIYGGVAYEPVVEALSKGVEIVVGTPGRLLDMAKSKQLRLDRVSALVLDEADRMLDLGFLDDVERILAMLPGRRQTMLFSATMPDPIVTLARRFMNQPVTVHAHHDDRTGPSPQTKQFVYRAHSLNKIEVVGRILQATGRGLTMVFTRTKRAADRAAEDLDFRGFAVAAVHGDLGQGARERALRAFRAGKIDVLVATDVAARGLDVTGVTHVINYDCPEDADTYIHRIGRTGRAGEAGVAVTFVDWDDMPRWRLIDKSLGLDMPEPAETYHTSEHLFTDLAIPRDSSGTLASADRTRVGLSAEKLEDVEGKRGGVRAGRARPGSGRSAGSAGTGGRGRPATDTPRPVTESAQPSRQRQRRRREDVPVEGQAGSDQATPAAVEVGPDGAAGPGETAGPRRPRNRRRGGRGRGDGGTADPGGAAGPTGDPSSAGEAGPRSASD
ncbi:MAG TPA: DEAD/DEAH box helicase [Micromonosporaceae bacterium]|nr:DEAD/DEAH box helicase [Micromonosporaceae bacterium]